MRAILKKMKYGLLGFICAFAGGCAAATLQVPRMKPAEINMNRFRRVAVYNVEGQDGNLLQDELTAGLFETNYFEVKNQQEFLRILNIQALQQSGISGALDPTLLAQAGKLLPEAAMITGRITGRRWNERLNKQQGIEIDLAGNKRPVYLYSRSGDATVTAILTVTDLTSGRILATKNLKGDFAGSGSDQLKSLRPLADYEINAQLPHLDSNQALAECRKKIIEDFKNTIAPHQVIDAVVLYRGDGVFQGGDDPAFASGMGYARAGQWEDAAGSFKESAEKLEQAPAGARDPQMIARAWYNHGISLVYNGDFDEGITAFDKAYKVEADQRFVEAKNTAKKLKEEARKLQEQLTSSAVDLLLKDAVARGLFKLYDQATGVSQ